MLVKIKPVSRRDGLQFLAGLSLSGVVSRVARAQTNPDVIIVGAGLSGLNAAFLLEEQGAKVLVLEGKRRIGGRVYSVDQIPGHPEAGANALAGPYPRLRSMAERLHIPLEDRLAHGPLNRARALILDGKVISPETWRDSPRNPFPKDLKTIMPWEYTGRIVSQNNPFTSLDDWHSKDFLSYDISLHDFLRFHGATDEIIELAVNTNFPDGNSAHDVSMLNIFGRDFGQKFRQRFGPINMIAKGGNQRLPEGIAKALKSEVRLGTKVVGLRTDKTGVDVHCEDGAVHRARFAVCSAPVPVLQQITFDPILTGAQAHAIKSMAYSLCSKIHLVATKPFWKDDGLPAGMWTDGPAGVVSANTPTDSPEEVTSLTASPRGTMATYVDSLGPEAAKAIVIRAIEEARPAAKGRLKAILFHSWQLDQFAMGADFMIWKPGQITQFFDTLWEVHGRIHFCGQHTAATESGMEGAMESGERAALEILKQI